LNKPIRQRRSVIVFQHPSGSSDLRCSSSAIRELTETTVSELVCGLSANNASIARFKVTGWKAQLIQGPKVSDL
jgi:hypothetical protein